MDDSWHHMQIPLSPTTLASIRELNFERMTPVQAACIPLFMQNKDVAAEAITGSGKTLAFVIPILERLIRRGEPLRKCDVGSIIITPTRELALQINEVLTYFLKQLPEFSSLLLIGGELPKTDIEKFKSKGGHILVATPGRLEDMFRRNQDGFNLASAVKALEVLVLDEADRLLDMGFKNSINAILSYLPKQRRTGLFSATQTDEVESLIRAGLRNPVRINVKEKQTNSTNAIQRTPSTLENSYMICESDEKFNQLISFLRTHKKQKIMIFFSTCACVDYFSRAINSFLKTVPVLCIHGKMKQKRNKIFGKFRQMPSGVLVCTDVMARGVDIPMVHWVIQYDPPSSATSFVHRCGRTARIGNLGNALVFLLPTEDTYVNFIALNQKVPLFQLEKSTETPNVLPKLLKMSLKDRAMYDKGMKAYVSFVQSYAKHECNMIFRIKDLDFGRLASGFGLLKIPKMPELKGKTICNFQEVVFDLSNLSYRDKNLEKQRKLRLQSEDSTTSSKRKKWQMKTLSWSKHVERKERKQKRKDVKEKKQSLKRKDVNEKKQSLKRKADDTNDEDLEDISRDVRLMKKLKKGKMSQQDFDKEFIQASDEEVSS